MSEVVQATVASWSDEGGSAALDTGVRLPIGADVLAASAFRFVRPGQRVDLVLVAGVVTWMGLPGTAATG